MNTIPKFVPKFEPNSRKKRQRKVTFADDHSIVPTINQVCLFRIWFAYSLSIQIDDNTKNFVQTQLFR